MLTRIFKPAVIILTLLLAVILPGGCVAQKKPLPPPGARTPNARDNVYDNIYRDTRRIGPQTPAKDTAEDIAARAVKMAGVKNAYVVVMGNVALIGINLDENLQDLSSDTIKRRVADMAEGHKRIVQAMVTSDPDIVARIKEISDGVRAGRPLTEFYDEIGEILNRLKPKS